MTNIRGGVSHLWGIPTQQLSGVVSPRHQGKSGSPRLPGPRRGRKEPEEVRTRVETFLSRRSNLSGINGGRLPGGEGREPGLSLNLNWKHCHLRRDYYLRLSSFRSGPETRLTDPSVVGGLVVRGTVKGGGDRETSVSVILNYVEIFNSWLRPGNKYRVKCLHLISPGQNTVLV